MFVYIDRTLRLLVLKTPVARQRPGFFLNRFGRTEALIDRTVVDAELLLN